MRHIDRGHYADERNNIGERGAIENVKTRVIAKRADAELGG